MTHTTRSVLPGAALTRCHCPWDRTDRVKAALAALKSQELGPQAPKPPPVTQPMEESLFPAFRMHLKSRLFNVICLSLPSELVSLHPFTKFSEGKKHTSYRSLKALQAPYNPLHTASAQSVIRQLILQSLKLCMSVNQRRL